MLRDPLSLVYLTQICDFDGGPHFLSKGISDFNVVSSHQSFDFELFGLEEVEFCLLNLKLLPYCREVFEPRLDLRCESGSQI